jgi:hypothetical protein
MQPRQGVVRVIDDLFFGVIRVEWLLPRRVTGVTLILKNNGVK